MKYEQVNEQFLFLQRQSNLSFEQKRTLYAHYLKEIRKLAYSGNGNAQFDLALHYEDFGYWGTPNPYYNLKKCFFWYTKACSNNHSEACVSLASFYEKGLGVKKSKAREFKLLLKAAKLGNVNAMNNLAIVCKERKEYELAVYWLNKALELQPEDGDYQFELGKLYYDGLGVRRSYKKAYELFQAALFSRNISQYSREEVMFYVGKMYLRGQHVAKSPGVAKYLIIEANRDNDHEDITRFLANTLQLGKSVRPEKIKLPEII